VSTLIAAPYPKMKVSILLPSPRFEDTQAAEQTVSVIRSMAGDTYTYVKSSDRKTIALTFDLSRMKLLELQAFLKIYYRAPLRLTLHDGSQWEASLTANPFEGRAVSRASNWPGKEAEEVRLEFSAKRIS
jgi:hypothetical protein